MGSTEDLLVEEFTHRSAFEKLSGDWDGLLSAAASDTPFLTHQWQTTWWDNFSEGKDLRMLAVRDRARRLTGLAPLYLDGKGDRAELIGSQDLCDYQDVLASRGEEEDVLRAILSYLRDSRRLPLHLHSLPASSPSLTALNRLADEGVCDLKVTEGDSAPTLTLPSSFEAYLSLLDSRHRHELRRKMRRIEAEGSTALLKDESGSKLSLFIELHKKSSVAKRDFMDGKREKFFRDMAGAFAKEGWLTLFFLQFQTESIATLLCFNHENSFYVYNSGYDPAYSALSPGAVLLAYSIRDVISQGAQEFNLLRGDEPYKYHLGARDLKLLRIWIQPRE